MLLNTYLLFNQNFTVIGVCAPPGLCLFSVCQGERRLPGKRGPQSIPTLLAVIVGDTRAINIGDTKRRTPPVAQLGAALEESTFVR